MVERTLPGSGPAPEEAAAYGLQYFEGGYYCAESVLQAIGAVNGVDVAGLSRLVTGMCGGMARSGGPCGALLGGIAAVGLLYGRDLPGDDKTLCYRLTYQLVQGFEKLFGARDCHGVLPCDIATPEGSEIFQREQMGQVVCPEVVEKTAALVQSLINRREELTHPLV